MLNNNNDFKFLFPIFKKNPKLVYFDTAATSLKPKEVIDAIYKFYNFNGISFKNSGFLSQEVKKIILDTKKKTANFINSFPEEIFFTKNTTESLNILAMILGKKIKPQDEIITSELEHNSSLFPWIKIAQEKKAKIIFIPLNKENQITVSNFKKVLSQKTKIVVLNHISNVLGYETPIKMITQLAHQKKALVILDAAQSIGNIKIDVKDLNIDFMAFSAHKMYGPFGIGILFGKKNLLSNLNPIFVGSGNVHKIIRNKLIFSNDLDKFETGTPNIGGIIAFQKSLDFINRISFEQIKKKNQDIFSKITEKLKNFRNIEILNPNSKSSIILCNSKYIHFHDLESFLVKNNVYVRTGKYCSDFVIKKIKKKNTIRISIGIYNNEKDIDILIKSLQEANNFFLK
jgi:cysteine desulfurase/selenocysteine lyase